MLPNTSGDMKNRDKPDWNHPGRPGLAKAGQGKLKQGRN